MAQKRNSRNATQASTKSLPWGPMLLSFAVGAFVMFLVHLNKNVEPEQFTTANTKQKTQQNSPSVEPVFEFYSLLPEMEVVVNTPQRQTPTPRIKPTPVKDDKSTYLLQVGSFRKMSDADGFKARLALLGIESKVQTVTIDNKDTWHRVQVGPINGRKQAEVVKQQLQQNKIESLLVRSKRG